jgi:hypothetical protein
MCLVLLLLLLLLIFHALFSVQQITSLITLLHLRLLLLQVLTGFQIKQTICSLTCSELQRGAGLCLYCSSSRLCCLACC